MHHFQALGLAKLGKGKSHCHTGWPSAPWNIKKYPAM